MSLVKNPSLTPQKLAANQANGRLAHGPSTPEGLERIRAANIRHGFYSQAPGEALRALGEDPAEFEHQLESLLATWQPADSFQTRLVMRLARALWRMERADRVQESIAVRQLERLDENVERLALEAREQYVTSLERLKSLTAAVAREDYFTGLAEIKTFDDLYGSEPKGRPEEIFVLLYRLLKPQPKDWKPGADDPLPLPDVPVAEGREREKVRKELQDLLSQEVQVFKAAHAQRGDQLVETTSPYFRDAMMAPLHPGAALVARMEDSSFRQVERLTSLLIKLKEQSKAARSAGTSVLRPTVSVALRPNIGSAAGSQNEGISHDVIENKGAGM